MIDGRCVTPLSLRRAALLAAVYAAMAMLAGCVSHNPKQAADRDPADVAESEYGATASLVIDEEPSGLPRGGGREQIGKPYQINGRWYYPQEDAGYAKVGAASWYGDAFHGRLTANGEIYDMTRLTAAHPTMPLPSYARVTNTESGSSVIVRVNDRGPFAHGRIIDLSRRAAELLDYRSAGVAEVEVEYLGRAPLHGRDEQFLMASYQPGGPEASGEPSNGAGPVMVALNGPTPAADIKAPVPFPVDIEATDPVLPAFGPVAPERPLMDPILITAALAQLPALSYAESRIPDAARALAAFSAGAQPYGSTSKRETGYIAAGTFGSHDEAERHARVLARLGRIELISAEHRGATWHVLSLYPDGRATLDAMLLAAWSSGASEAIAVRD